MMQVPSESVTISALNLIGRDRKGFYLSRLETDAAMWPNTFVGRKLYSFIAHIENFKSSLALWNLNDDFVTLFSAHQGAAHGRGVGNESFLGVGFVVADDRERDFVVGVAVANRYGCAEHDPFARLFLGVDDLGARDAILYEANARIEVRFALERGVVLGVFRKVTVGARIRLRYRPGAPPIKLIAII